MSVWTAVVSICCCLNVTSDNGLATMVGIPRAEIFNSFNTDVTRTKAKIVTNHPLSGCWVALKISLSCRVPKALKRSRLNRSNKRRRTSSSLKHAHSIIVTPNVGGYGGLRVNSYLDIKNSLNNAKKTDNSTT